MGIVIEEADETHFWLELVISSEIVAAAKMDSLLDEADQLTAIFVAARETAKNKRSS
jgi:hypothetical protein